MREQEPMKARFLGVVVSVRGSVVDIRFDAHLPAIYSRSKMRATCVGLH